MFLNKKSKIFFLLLKNSILILRYLLVFYKTVTQKTQKLYLLLFDHKFEQNTTSFPEFTFQITLLLSFYWVFSSVESIAGRMSCVQQYNWLVGMLEKFAPWQCKIILHNCTKARSRLWNFTVSQLKSKTTVSTHIERQHSIKS